MSIYFAAFLPTREGGYAVEFPDFPEAFTQAETFEECLIMGADVLAITAEEYIKARKELPTPSGLEAIEAWAESEKTDPDLDPARKIFFQAFKAPNIDMTPVRVSVSFAKSALEEIDTKAKLYGYTRSGFLSHAAQQYRE